MYLGLLTRARGEHEPPHLLKAFSVLGNGVGSLKKLGHVHMKRGIKRNLISVYIACSGRNKNKMPELQSINKRNRNIKCIVDYLVLSCYLKVFLARLSLCLVFILASS